jgi:hypothetical protein
MAVEEVLITAPRWQRNIGGIVANVTIEEIHQDELVITEHPVEQGAVITDHAYKLPADLIIRAGWSNSAKQSGGDEGYAQEVYEKLLELQVSRVPFQVITGKRRYNNMLIAALGITTDETTETSLICTAHLREVVLTQTAAAVVPPSAVHATPEKTAPTTQTGTRRLAPAPNFNPSVVNP